MDGGRRSKAAKGRLRKNGKHGRKTLPTWIVVISLLSIVLIGLGLSVSRPFSSSKHAQSLEAESQFTSFTPTAVVGIVDQFYNESPSFTDQAVRFLDGRGISVKVHRDEEVNVELYRNLATYGYRLIILRVHAGVCGRLEGNQTFIFTAQKYATGSYMFEQLTDQIRSGVPRPR